MRQRVFSAWGIQTGPFAFCKTLELNEGRPRHNEGHRYDGRGNVNVGRGRFYQRGDDLLVECEFPRRDSLATDIVWYRKTYG